MTDILLEKNKKVYYEYFAINKNKFTMKRFLMAFLIVLLYVMILYGLGHTNNTVLLIGGSILAFLIGYKLLYMQLIMTKGQHDLMKEYIFPTFLRYFVSLISTQGNVYLTLKETVNYVENPLKKELEKLIKRLDDNKVDNHTAFMEFAESIGTSEAIMIMNMIDDFNEHGINKDDIRELENTVLQLQENKMNELIEYKVAKVDRFSNPILIIAIAYIFAFVMISYTAYMKFIDI